MQKTLQGSYWPCCIHIHIQSLYALINPYLKDICHSDCTTHKQTKMQTWNIIPTRTWMDDCYLLSAREFQGNNKLDDQSMRDIKYVCVC